MPTPSYHLRPNKAVDRFIFIETIHHILDGQDVSNYTYHGFGGPYLEDFKTLHERFPEMDMVSIEKNEEVYKRQRFHKPFRKIRLVNDTLHSFLNGYTPSGDPSIFWLDYTNLDYPLFEEFMLVLSKVAPGSIVRITLQANGKFYKKEEDIERFQNKFSDVLPSPTTVPPSRDEPLCKLLQQMLGIAAQKVLPSATGMVFQPINSFYYKDGLGMYTLTGVVCSTDEAPQLKKKLRGWTFASLRWDRNPKEINVPTLSTKERMHLQSYLPCKTRNLVKSLGYEIDGKNSEAQMQQYAQFYRQYPYFIRAVP